MLFEIVEKNTKILDGPVPKPWLIQVTIQGAKDYLNENRHDMRYMGRLDRNMIHSQEGIWDEGNDIVQAMKPVLDSLANCFDTAYSACIRGRENSGAYSKN
ncbi:MAG: hypothetical protein FWG96_02535 [Methanomassiliicoccaceae archaeon]|nr:hypothetical protein [Methanomassiliicoccaceae archaeon]